MDDRIDLHIHTNYSDGLDSPEKVLEIVRSKGISAFAICDHDNIDAYGAVVKMLKPGDPEIITGVELSAGKSGDDIHIIGYMFDPKSKEMEKAVSFFSEKRNLRAVKMLKKLNDLGVEIDIELVREIAGGSAIGRPHVAEALFRVGAVKHYNKAFNKYIGLHDPAYVPKENLKPEQAIDLIHNAGGLAVLAHPAISDVYKYIDEFSDHGLDGIEIFHSSHDKPMRKKLRKIARDKNLLMTGGSDYHGRSDHHGMIGSQPTPTEFLLKMKEKLNLN